MFDFIKNNIGWIKDFITLIFVATASVIGILTYRRARFTLLQPIRTESIKRQSDTLSNLLYFLRRNNNAFESGIDYVNIVQISVLIALKDYGFVFKEQSRMFDDIEKNISGWIPCGSSQILHDVEIVQTFKQDKKETEKTDIGKIRFENLKNGIAEIDRIYLTKAHDKFRDELSSFINDPFLPTSFIEILAEYIKTIQNNLVIILKKEIEQFLIDFSRHYFKEGTAPKFDPIGVYNAFNHKRKHHNSSINHLREEIRKYMLIDEP